MENKGKRIKWLEDMVRDQAFRITELEGIAASLTARWMAAETQLANLRRGHATVSQVEGYEQLVHQTTRDAKGRRGFTVVEEERSDRQGV